jgi:hypothetical protein
MRNEVIEVHLRYKLENHVDLYSSIGLVSSEYITSEILHSLYPLEEVELVARKLCDDGLFELYYSGNCPHCDAEFVFHEEDTLSLTVKDGLMKHGEPCRACLRNMYRPTIVPKFGIAQNVLEMTGYEEPKNERYLDRIMRWLRIKK